MVVRAVSTRAGLYFGVMQLFFTLSWVIYVIYLPQLAAQVGIGRGSVAWILVLDQLVFALCDWAVGIAADRVAAVVGRLGTVVAAVTALSALAFLLLPWATVNRSAFLVLVVIWAVTSSALRVPPLTLLGRYTPPDQQPWVGSLFVLGIGAASVLAPFLSSRLAAYDPRIVFAASAISVVVVTFSIAWAEKTLARLEPREKHTGGAIQIGAFGWFLIAVVLVAFAFQVHFFINAQLLFLKLAAPADVPNLLSLFWIGFTVLMLPASWLVKRFGGVAVMMLGAVVAAVAAWAAAQAWSLAWLVGAQFVSGGAWAAVMVSAVAAALSIGRAGKEGTAVGALYSLMAVAAVARIVLVAGHFDQLPAVSRALLWVPSLSWLAAALVLLAAMRRRSLRPA